MEQKAIQAVIGILVALMAWNFKTLNDMQLQMIEVNSMHASMSDIHELQLKVQALEWRIGQDAMQK